jgi:amidase
MSLPELLRHDAVEQAALVRAGEITARELIEAALRACDELDPDVNAFVARCDERALAEADLIRAGDPRPLCGVPIALKDLVSAVDGLPTTNGSYAFGDWRADHDSAHVRRLREAGAIVIGRTNSPELGLRPVTENARFGTTRNPWDLSLSPGGSSGGSAAAVAAGIVALADGSDLGGSIRIPASCCGLVGLKPSRGRVSIGPDFGDLGQGTVADGVLTRTVADTAVALDAIAGPEPGDHAHLPLPVTSFADAVTTPPGRVAVQLAPIAPLGAPVDAEPRLAARRAAEALAGLGHHVDERAPDWDAESFPAAWGQFALGTLQHLLRVLARLHGRPVDPERLEPATRAWIVDSPPVSAADHLEAAERLWAFARRVLASWPPDGVLVTPTLTRLPVPAGGMQAEPGVTDEAMRFSVLVRIWNVTGQPAITVPLHETADGLRPRARIARPLPTGV